MQDLLLGTSVVYDWQPRCRRTTASPSTERRTGVVVVDLRAPEVGQRPGLDDRVDVGPQVARQVEVDRRTDSRARPRGSGRGRRRTPPPVRRGGRGPSRCAERCRCRRRGTTGRRPRGWSTPAGGRRRGALGVGEHGHVGAQPADRLERTRPGGRRPGPRSRRTRAAARARPAPAPRGVTAAPGSPAAAGGGPAIVQTMSTVCRVSTTSCTR